MRFSFYENFIIFFKMTIFFLLVTKKIYYFNNDISFDKMKFFHLLKNVLFFSVILHKL